MDTVFDDGYDPKLVFLWADTTKPEGAKDLRLKFPNVCWIKFKKVLNRSPVGEWASEHDFIRAALYHGLHYLAQLLDSHEVREFAADYAVWAKARGLRQKLERWQESVKDFEEIARIANSPEAKAELKRDLEHAITTHPDSATREQLKRIYRGL